MIETEQTDTESLAKLEQLRKESEKEKRVYAFSDGQHILGADAKWHMDFLISLGFGIYAVFENGQRINMN